MCWPALCVSASSEGEVVNKSRGAASKLGLPGKQSDIGRWPGQWPLSNIYTHSVEGESNSNLLPLHTACLAGWLGISQADIVDLLQFCTLLTWKHIWKPVILDA